MRRYGEEVKAERDRLERTKTELANDSNLSNEVKGICGKMLHYGQAMVRGRQCPLPWVPDLAGKESDQPGGVLVVGSAYSPFITGLAKRNARPALSSYEKPSAISRQPLE